jgi:hypothetical protein
MIRTIPASQVRNYWPKVFPLLKPAIEAGRRATPEETLKWLERGDYQLWVAGTPEEIVAAATTSITVYPGSKWLTIVHCGGKNMWRWLQDGVVTLESWAVGNGCIGPDGEPLVEIVGRIEWGNVLPGYRVTGVVAERVSEGRAAA